MTTPLLITRPEEDAAGFAAQVEAALPAQFQPLLSPLLEVVPEDVSLPLDGVQALLFTSRNGVRCFGRMTAERDIPAMCVGRATAQEAEALGIPAHSADGDVSALASMAALAYQEGGGHYLHLRGRETTGGLVDALLAEGIAAEERIIYDQRALRLSTPARDALTGSQKVIAPVFSPRTAALLADEIEEAGATAPLHLVAVSQAVAAALSALASAEVTVTERPDVAAVIEALTALD